MKRNTMLLAVAALLLLAGCSKEKKCKCTYSETLDAFNNPAVTYIHVSNGFSCKKITQLGYERQMEGSLVRSMETVICEEATD